MISIVRKYLFNVKYRCLILSTKPARFRCTLRRAKLRVGQDWGSWVICPDGLNSSSIVYSVGVGRDVTFDIDLIDRFGVTVHAFDPTPGSIEWARGQSLPERFVLHETGLADHDGFVRFSPTKSANTISWTMVESGQADGPSVEVPVRRLAGIMRDLGHSHIDLLKMDIEGEEYAVIPNILASGLDIHQIVLECHPRFIEDGWPRTRDLLQQMHEHGYGLFNVTFGSGEFSLIRTDG